MSEIIKPAVVEQDLQIKQHKNIYKIVFNAMASPCEVLLYTDDRQLVEQVAQLAVSETRRIEKKFSRYISDNLCFQLNHSNGQAIAIDPETFQLLEYASQLFELSDGLFDITSGVLRKIWKFQTGEKPPTQKQITDKLQFIGFEKLQFDESKFVMPKNMEIDFGGIGKEYCVDRVANLIAPLCDKNKASFLVNFGGDLVAINYDSKHPAWIVGLESVKKEGESQAIIEVSQGAIATSGSTKRVFEYQGKTYAHILNPKTGYPIEGAPRSVSVFAQTCSLAGGMSTLAQLQGEKAETFLNENNIKNICCW